MPGPCYGQIMIKMLEHREKGQMLNDHQGQDGDTALPGPPGCAGAMVSAKLEL